MPNQQIPEQIAWKSCLRPAIPEIALAADYLDKAVTAHIAKQPQLAAELIDQANIPAIREWAESIRGKTGLYNQHWKVIDAPSTIEKTERGKARMPSLSLRRALHERDGYHCRFCGIPVIRSEIRKLLLKLYPDVVPWGLPNSSQHTALQVMQANYDHVVPHSRGGKSDLTNLIVTCGPCNYGRMKFTLEEMRLTDPREREPISSAWDGLERLLHNQ
jgi:hypothetical protein